jgi:hypothetical protein
MQYILCNNVGGSGGGVGGGVGGAIMLVAAVSLYIL